jgi:hypothetical protein
VSGQSQTDSHAWNWPLRLLLVFLVLATTAKFAAFINALSFGSGLLVSILQAGLWWWMARGLGIFGVVGAWLLQTAYLVHCNSDI